MNDLHDLAAPYALDALETEERRRFERHLDRCAECRREVARLGEGVAAIADRLSIEAPDSMRRAVMDEIDRTVPTKVVPLRRRRVFTSMVAAAAAVVVVAAASLLVLDRGPSPATVLAAADVVTIDLEGTGAYVEAVDGSLAFSADQQAAVVRFDGLAAAPVELTYQLWVIDEAGATAAGLFTPDDSGEALVLVDGRVEPGDAVGITLEPASGSDAPTGEVLFVVTV